MPSRPYTARGRELLALRLAGKRRCQKCRKTLRLNARNFYKRDYEGNLAYVCKTCHKRKVRSREIARKGMDR